MCVHQRSSGVKMVRLVAQEIVRHALDEWEPGTMLPLADVDVIVG